MSRSDCLEIWLSFWKCTLPLHPPDSVNITKCRFWFHLSQFLVSPHLPQSLGLVFPQSGLVVTVVKAVH